MNHPDRPNACPVHWPRAIVHADMNAFFAAVEQRDFPRLRGRPVAITNGSAGTCIITCSYEARAFGVRTGMRLREARRLCPGLIRRPARPYVYAEVSATIMQALTDISPDIEVYSVDEAFLDVTRCQRLHGTPPRMGRMAKARVQAAAGLSCSVGVAGDKTTAKFAANLHKPDGFCVIPPWEAGERLADVPATQLSGIADGIGAFLARHGARTCGEVARLPVSVLARRFGPLGRRLWLMCQGRDPDPLHTGTTAPKRLGHGKILPPDTRDVAVLATYLEHMSEKLAARLRRCQLDARCFAIGLRTREGWLGGRYQLSVPGHDGAALFALCRQMLDECWDGEGVFQVQVTALDPRPHDLQLDLFAPRTAPHEEVNAVMDAVNRRFGAFTLAPARLLGRTRQPDVIGPCQVEAR